MADYGVSFVIVAVFIWSVIDDKKRFNKSLEKISEGNQNIAKVLAILEEITHNNTDLIKKHDERAIEFQRIAMEELKEMKFVVSHCQTTNRK
jgi:hypothetical protein